MLNPDGSLNLTTGFHGALDPSGWRMEYAPGGAPVFRPAAPSAPSAQSDTWNALGSGLNSEVFAVAVEGSNVYVGGYFSDAGGNANADHIARWDGSSWNALGSGLNNWVYAIGVEGPNVYAGGVFTDAGGNADADRIARWDGSSWNALGSGLNAEVQAIAVDGLNVYAGGWFTDAGGNANADRIARWDGSSWNALGSGLNNWVYAITVEGANVYVGGAFGEEVGNPGANGIARWDGSSWNSLGRGLNSIVLAIAVVGPDVYVGGYFTDAGGNTDADHIARWNGSTWNALGSGLNNYVYAVGVEGSNVYVGGWFTDAGGNPNADHITRWDGSSWNALGSGLGHHVYAIGVEGPDVYVGGEFHSAGGNTNASRIARWGLPLYSVYLPVQFKAYNPSGCVNIPVLVRPSNNSMVDTLIPTYQWNPGNNPDATETHFQIALDPAFSQVRYQSRSTGIHGTTDRSVYSQPLLRNLSPNTVHYWRVFLKCGPSQTLYSAIWSFTPNSGGIILPPPVLVAPGNGSTTSATTVTLQWSPVSGASLYKYEYQRTDWTGPAGGWTTNAQDTIGPLDSGTYSWWVSAVNDYAIGNKSTTWQFTTPQRMLVKVDCVSQVTPFACVTCARLRNLYWPRWAQAASPAAMGSVDAERLAHAGGEEEDDGDTIQRDGRDAGQVAAGQSAQ